jgi:hypothetical protein
MHAKGQSWNKVCTLLRAPRDASAGGHLLYCCSLSMRPGIACVAAPCICPPATALPETF